MSQQVKDWNSKYPLDRWWRKKYNIPFGSKTHLDQDPLDIKFEWLEDKFFEDLSLPLKYVVGDWLIIQTQSKEELDREYEEFDDSLIDYSSIDNIK